jgi:ABC-type polar amino acid transport system ATPase subunit
MDEGRIVEEGRPEEFFANPKEERTRAFLNKILVH